MVLMTLFALLGYADNTMAQQTKKSKSASQLTEDYVKYSQKKSKGKQMLAERRSSDPATVTREKSDTTTTTAPASQGNNFRARFNQFRQKSAETYANFRDEANKKYADFIRQAWEKFQGEPPVQKPKEKEVPPVVIADEDLLKPVKPNPIKIKEKIIEIPTIKPQPIPVEPIPFVPTIEEPTPNVVPPPVVLLEPVKPLKDVTIDKLPIKIEQQPVKQEPVEVTPPPTPTKPDTRMAFNFYGTEMKVHFTPAQKFTLKNCSSDAVADAWEVLAKKDYNNLIRDCLTLRETCQLSDWAYLQMLEKMAQACLGKTNEATLLQAYVYCQSGYKMRMGTDNNKLYVLYSTPNVVYGKSYFRVDGDSYYVYGGDVSRMDICRASFPKEQNLSLWIPQPMKLSVTTSDLRELKSRRYPDVNMTVQVNKNLIDFMETYPSSMEGEDFMTRWAMYANTPLEDRLQQTLLPALKSKLQGLSQKEAVERLLNWVQTAFVYEYDEKVWGEDRAFFADETLFYPYCDCEDRSILFTRLVRDLLGLKCVLVYYPGHLASAVRFNEDVAGDYIPLDGGKYVVCDPTYINAGVGRTMRGMNNAEATVIRLK